MGLQMLLLFWLSLEVLVATRNAFNTYWTKTKIQE